MDLIDFLVELQTKQEELNNLPCYIHKFYLSNLDDVQGIVMVVQEGSRAAREMSREFTRVLGKKVRVSSHPYESYANYGGVGTHDYIVTLVEKKKKVK